MKNPGNFFNPANTTPIDKDGMVEIIEKVDAGELALLDAQNIHEQTTQAADNDQARDMQSDKFAYKTNKQQQEHRTDRIKTITVGGVAATALVSGAVFGVNMINHPHPGDIDLSLDHCSITAVTPTTGSDGKTTFENVDIPGVTDSVFDPATIDKAIEAANNGSNVTVSDNGETYTYVVVRNADGNWVRADKSESGMWLPNGDNIGLVCGADSPK